MSVDIRGIACFGRPARLVGTSGGGVAPMVTARQDMDRGLRGGVGPDGAHPPCPASRTVPRSSTTPSLAWATVSRAVWLV